LDTEVVRGHRTEQAERAQSQAAWQVATVKKASSLPFKRFLSAMAQDISI